MSDAFADMEYNETMADFHAVGELFQKNIATAKPEQLGKIIDGMQELASYVKHNVSAPVDDAQIILNFFDLLDRFLVDHGGL